MKFSEVNRRRPSRETPLGPGVKKDGCFCSLTSREQYKDIHNVVNDQGFAMHYRAISITVSYCKLLAALATVSVAILSPRIAIKILCLG